MDQLPGLPRSGAARPVARAGAAITDGARDEEQVGEHCLAGTGCGGCVEHICQLLGEAGVPGHGLCSAALAS